MTTAFVFSCEMFAVGFWFTAGMWLFCKMSRWAPVNIVVNVEKSE